MKRPLYLLLLLAACGDPGGPGEGGNPASGENYEGLAPPDTAGARTILLLSLDTLRADHLSLYGYERPTSPELEELASEAVVYTEARSTAPWTLPSHASLFTGLYPHEHGAHNVMGTETDYARALGLQATTLAEVLSKGGYRTAAFVANIGFLAPRFALDQGFSEYQAERGTVGEVNDRVLSWLDEQGDEPVFLFVNYMDTHRPYNCVPRPDFPDHGGPRTSGKRMKEARRLLIQGASELPPELVGELIDQYDTAIANLDEGLGLFFEALAERGRFDDALLVITSDHGEFFGEKALVEHSKDVYDPVLRVPLIVRPPGGTSSRMDDAPISGAHVPGIVLSHAGVDPSSPDLEPFFANWPRKEVVAEQYASRPHDMKGSWLERMRRVRRTIVRNGWKYIESSDGAHELYHLESDPEELNDLFATEPERARVLAADLGARIERGSLRAAPLVGERVDVEAGDADTMAELGYSGDEEDGD